MKRLIAAFIGMTLFLGGCGLCRYKDHNETAGCIEGRYRVCYGHCHINNGNVGI